MRSKKDYKNCARCGRKGLWRNEFCGDCREVENARNWAQWNRMHRKAVAA